MRFECGTHPYSAGTVRAPAQCGFFVTLVYIKLGQGNQAILGHFTKKQSQSVIKSSKIISGLLFLLPYLFLAFCLILKFLLKAPTMKTHNGSAGTAIFMFCFVPLWRLIGKISN